MKESIGISIHFAKLLYMDFSAAVKEMMAKSNPENKTAMQEATEM